MTTFNVGDLVQVVKPSACPAAPADHALGHTFVAQETLTITAGICAHCGNPHFHGPVQLVFEDKNLGWPAYRLKRIPPLDELEQNERREEVPA